MALVIRDTREVKTRSGTTRTMRRSPILFNLLLLFSHFFFEGLRAEIPCYGVAYYTNFNGNDFYGGYGLESGLFAGDSPLYDTVAFSSNFIANRGVTIDVYQDHLYWPYYDSSSSTAFGLYRSNLDGSDIVTINVGDIPHI